MDVPDSNLGPRGSRVVSSLTPEQLNKYQNYVKDASDRVVGPRVDEYSVPDVSGMMCLKLFMSVEVI